MKNAVTAFVATRELDLVHCAFYTLSKAIGMCLAAFVAVYGPFIHGTARSAKFPFRQISFYPNSIRYLIRKLLFGICTALEMF